MKTLLRLLTAVSLTTVAASSVVACGTQTKAPDLNYRYGVLLKIYDENNPISLVQQKLKYENEKYLIVADEEIINSISFKDCLLVNGKAKNFFAEALLKELGFISGSITENYSETDFVAILHLVATIKNSNLNAISIKNDDSDFQVYNSTCQMDIMDKVGEDAKVVKSYTINTTYSNLNVANELINNIQLFNLKLSYTEGFKLDWSISNFKLRFQSQTKQKRFNALVELLNTKVTIKFYNEATGGTEMTGNFPNSKVYLQIIFDTVAIPDRIDCGTPTAPTV